MAAMRAEQSELECSPQCGCLLAEALDAAGVDGPAPPPDEDRIESDRERR